MQKNHFQESHNSMPNQDYQSNFYSNRDDMKTMQSNGKLNAESLKNQGHNQYEYGVNMPLHSGIESNENYNNKRIIPKPDLLKNLNNDIEKYFNDISMSSSVQDKQQESLPFVPDVPSSTFYTPQTSHTQQMSSSHPLESTSSKIISSTISTTISREESSTQSSSSDYSDKNSNFVTNKNVDGSRPIMAKFIDASSTNYNKVINLTKDESNLSNDYIEPNNQVMMAKKLTNNMDSNIINPRLSFGNMLNIPLNNQYGIQQPMHHQQIHMQPEPFHSKSMGHLEKLMNSCNNNPNSKIPDETYCNFYHRCSNGNYQPALCPEGYLYSEKTQVCEAKLSVDCGKRIVIEFDHSSIPVHVNFMDDYYNSAPSPKVINGSLECTLGTDGYFADPEFCNIYHHCLAGVDYAEQCPHQLVWNDRKKMCDWQTSVNCTGRIIPVAQGQSTFCTDKSDNKYPDSIYCNVFHHCVGGIDNVVRCDGELQWNDKDKKCDWESKVRCMGKMLPSEKHYNSTFCIGKFDGPYAHEEYCNVYHVCESGTDNIRQCPNQLFWDYRTKRCDWSGNVECTGRTLITLSTDTTLFCMERRDGVYGDPNWCNVYHNCLSGVDFKTKCPVGLIWNETKKDCDWSDSTQCSTGNFLRDAADMDKKTFCIDKPNGKYAHEVHCNRYYVCQNGKDIIFTCQNNLRYNATKQECDWAVNVNCFGKADYMWEGIKENFCKNRVSRL